jgi:hypothetical protein
MNGTSHLASVSSTFESGQTHARREQTAAVGRRLGAVDRREEPRQAKVGRREVERVGELLPRTDGKVEQIELELRDRNAANEGLDVLARGAAERAARLAHHGSLELLARSTDLGGRCAARLEALELGARLAQETGGVEHGNAP